MADQPIRLTTVLGADVLRLKRMSASEELGRLAEFSVYALSDRNDIRATELLGKPAGVHVDLADGSVRHFHGLVCAFGLEGTDEGRNAYRLVLRPWLWLSTRRSDTRIFQNQTLMQILDTVFQPFAPTVRYKLERSYSALEYCVQYRESDFDFASRLMERHGVYYYLEHAENQHTLVIVDAASAHANPAFGGAVPFRDAFDAGLDFEGISEWRVRQQIVSGQSVLTDYNFETPSTSLQVQSTFASAKGTSSTLEVYDYPGDHAVAADGDANALLRVGEFEARWHRVRGAGTARTLACGYTFDLQDHWDGEQNIAYLVTATHVECELSGYESGAGETRWRCEFGAIPKSLQFRPARATLRPTVPGPHTAVVVGKAGEEIWTDKHGRVKVQFHWDRLGAKDENSSCWLRVSQPLAGKGFGFVALPRIGQEVVVDFLEGDPDRPLVTGRVYNAEQTPPYELPANQSVATFRTQSTKGGGTGDFNELRFEDKNGSEALWMRAQKDFRLHVKNDAQSVVKHDRFGIVENNDQLHVKGKSQLTVDSDRAIAIKGKLGTKVTSDVALQGDASISAKSGAAMDVKVGANLGVDAAANMHLKAGANLVIEAGATITLKAGASSVVIGAGTVSIIGPMVMINSGGSAGAGGGANPKAPDAPDAITEVTDPLNP